MSCTKNNFSIRYGNYSFTTTFAVSGGFAAVVG